MLLRGAPWRDCASSQAGKCAGSVRSLKAVAVAAAITTFSSSSVVITTTTCTTTTTTMRAAATTATTSATAACSRWERQEMKAMDGKCDENVKVEVGRQPDVSRTLHVGRDDVRVGDSPVGHWDPRVDDGAEREDEEGVERPTEDVMAVRAREVDEAGDEIEKRGLICERARRRRAAADNRDEAD